MRGPIAAGVLAGLFVVLIALAGFVAFALGRPESIPSTVPSITPAPSFIAAASTPPAASATPSSVPATATATSSPSPSISPSPSLTPSPAPVGLKVGDRAPALLLDQLGGGQIDTSAIVGQPIWIDFMATWCPSCRDELPAMEALDPQLADKMTVLIVDVGEDEDTVGTFLDSLNIDIPTGLDHDGAAQKTWGAYALPVHYWVTADGHIAAFLYGGADRQQFIDSIHTVLPDLVLSP